MLYIFKGYRLCRRPLFVRCVGDEGSCGPWQHALLVWLDVSVQCKVFPICTCSNLVISNLHLIFFTLSKIQSWSSVAHTTKFKLSASQHMNVS